MTDNFNSVPELLVVLPIYNESESIDHVLSGWLLELDASDCNYRILAINDGSTDDTHAMLVRWVEARPERVEMRSRENRGHGRSCLEGYREAMERGVEHVLQIDSDGQSLPEFFGAFWSLRGKHDVIYGIRTRRDGWQRKVASLILRLSLRLFEGVDCVDASVPYRLMRCEACATNMSRVPEDISLANVALAVMLRREAGIRHGAVPIAFPPRYGGEPSVPMRRFLAKAIELFRQLRDSAKINSTFNSDWLSIRHGDQYYFGNSTGLAEYPQSNQWRGSSIVHGISRQGHGPRWCRLGQA